MPLAVGARLGPYEIQAPLGSGAMGEVYRARDTRLGRSVAVKVLPPERSSSAEARARFDREAKAISQLSHPHICALFDVGRDGGTDYLVMELLEGETLAQRVARGPMPIPDVVRHGREIADALDRAHRAGIVHRDLKPANVVLTSSGVKLLDFGLARPVPVPFTAAGASTVETAQHGPELSSEGLVVGTLSYMAPEQVEGRPADARADLFALGLMLYEMVTGRRTFPGSTPAAVAAAILRGEPAPMRELRPECPPALERLVAACLVKDRAERWQSAHDLGVALAAAGETGAGPEPVASSRPRSRWLSVAPWGLAALAAAVALAALARPRAPQPPLLPVRFSLPPPPGSAFRSQVESLPIAVSPEGSRLAILGAEPGGRSRVWLRKLSSLEVRPVEGTDDAVSLFWSPDGTSLAFVANAKLQRVDLGSDVVRPVCDVREGIGLHGTWSPAGQILFATVEGQEILRVSASGGTPVAVVRPEASPGPVRVQWPSFLPDGRRFLYLGRYTDGRSRLLLGEEGKPPRDLGPGESVAEYVDPGVVVSAREGTLFGQRFELAGARFSGEPFPIAQPVRQFAPTGWALYSVSRNGVLVYGSQRDVSRLAWFDRAGTATKLEAEADAGPHSVRFSPDAQRALFQRYDSKTAQDVWVLDVVRGLETRLVSGPSADVFPVWLPDGRAIVYSSVRGRPPQLVLRELASGTERELAPPPRGLQAALDVTPDGRTLVFSERAPSGAFDLFSLPLPDGGKPTPLLQTPFNEDDLRLSPDGRFAAFTSNESGDNEVYLAVFPTLSDKVRVSRAGGLSPRWRADGRELFYLAGDGTLVAAPVRPGTREFGEARPLFRVAGPHGWAGFDVAPDGQRFLAIVRELVGSEQPLTVAVDAVAEALRSR
jgi:serine/threonine protein kinase/Tol biopolymer transport system component